MGRLAKQINFTGANDGDLTNINISLTPQKIIKSINKLKHSHE